MISGRCAVQQHLRHGQFKANVGLCAVVKIPPNQDTGVESRVFADS